MTTVVLFALLAGAGAMTRGAVTGRWNRIDQAGFPTGTLAVNVAGSFILGALRGSGLAAPALTVFGTGLIGAFTTFSGFAADADSLAATGRRPSAVAYITVSLAAGITAAALGKALISS